MSDSDNISKPLYFSDSVENESAGVDRQASEENQPDESLAALADTSAAKTVSELSQASTPSTPPIKMPSVIQPSWYYWIFAVSGFAGLIYESLWARYLKLFLGHAAYAQALVLAVFLFGLAAGAAICSRLSSRLSRPLIWYIIVEVIVAVVAVYFHEIFIVAEKWAVSFVLPRIESDTTAELFKWGLAAALILPQSILLGATFPLMSAGLLRLRLGAPGHIISMLYFSNSIGAAIGVLFGGFLLLPFAGLPGSVAFAGVLNAAAAAAVWILGHRFDDTGKPLPSTPAADARVGGYDLQRLVLTAAFVTGLASFIYEIVWVRMLSLLLGSSGHNFEIMLSAFIAGLAFGGLLVRRWVDKIEPLKLLGGIQLAMGVFALWSLFAFPLFYDILKETIPKIPKDDDGYLLFVGLGLLLSFAMMLPATICAGMTLPLLTRRLLDNGGESVIGRVYAANTIGAIVGVVITLHLLLPKAGVHAALIVGAVLDIGLGLVLLFFVARHRVVVGSCLTVAALIVAILFGGINPQVAAAGIFQHQGGDLPTVVFYQDGKTTSIAVTESTVDGQTTRNIKTNGKTDANLYQADFDATKRFTGDEMTMVLLGMLPLMYKPDAKTVMNIGFGSGLTSRTLLLSRNLRQLDNVEIEPKIVEGARHLGVRVAPVFDDPRNKFIFNDAKAVLARARTRYDVVVSEPSNPWVSGVAGLFTKEFYQRVRAGLTDDGIFIQWIPLYETEPRLVASVVQALSSVFGDFKFYLLSKADLIVVATPAEKLPRPLNAIFAQDEARLFLDHYGYSAVADVNLIALGRGSVFVPYFNSFLVPANSDYYPILENNASRAFFKGWSYALLDIFLLPIPVLEMLGGGSYSIDGTSIDIKYSPLVRKAAIARRWYANRDDSAGELQTLLNDMTKMVCPLDDGETDTKYLATISTIVSHLMPVLEKEKMSAVWRLLETDECMSTLLAEEYHVAGVYIKFWRALSLRDSATIIETTEALIQADDSFVSIVDLTTETGQILLLSSMAAHYQQGNYDKVILLLQELPLVIPGVQHAARLLAANAAEHL